MAPLRKNSPSLNQRPQKIRLYHVNHRALDPLIQCNARLEATLFHMRAPAPSHSQNNWRTVLGRLRLQSKFLIKSYEDILALLRGYHQGQHLLFASSHQYPTMEHVSRKWHIELNRRIDFREGLCLKPEASRPFAKLCAGYFQILALEPLLPQEERTKEAFSCQRFQDDALTYILMAYLRKLDSRCYGGGHFTDASGTLGRLLLRLDRILQKNVAWG